MSRIITSAILLLLLLAGLFFHSIFWLAFIIVFSVGGAKELSNIHFRGNLPVLSVLVILAAIAFPVNTYLEVSGCACVPNNALVAVFFIIIPVSFIFSSGDVEDFKISVPMALFGVIWIGYLMSFNIRTYFIEINGMHYGIQAMLLFAYMVCCNDIGAYYIGSSIGKRKLSKIYSPKKTVEGAVGGVFCSIVGAVVCHYSFAQVIPVYHVIVMAILVSTFGIFGDLVESVFKRSYEVKDAGDALPGHGGILDRADSVMMSAPVYYWYLFYLVAS